MPQINQLSTVTATELNGSDLLPIYSSSNGDARKLSLTALLSWFFTNFASPDYDPTILTPADGFTHIMDNDAQSKWIVLRPALALATGTIVLPLNTSAADGQSVLVTTTKQIASLSFNLNGATAIQGAPSVLAAEDKFTLRYESLTDTWVCVA